MKWCFLLNTAPCMAEFLGKISRQIIKEGDECLILANSKIAEFDGRKFFSNKCRFISKVDWCAKNYDENRQDFKDLSWREFFPTFERKTKLKLLDFGYDDSVGIISQLYQFLDYELQSEKPDVVINELPANVFTEIAYNLCKKKNIVYAGFVGSRFNGRVDIYDQETTCSFYKTVFDRLSVKEISRPEREFARKFIDDFISHKQLPSLTDDNSLIFFDKANLFKYYPKRLKTIFGARIRYFLGRKRFKSYDYESEAAMNSLFVSPREAALRKLKIIFQKNIFKPPGANDNFFFFPLHFQPEASTSVMSTYFCDQLASVKNAAFCLPFPYKLYVKEHPVAIGTRSDNFYKELTSIPNVVLIAPDESTESLIKQSRGIITLTSTVGMEAALAGKRVYTLGNVFYSYHPLCVKVDSFEELKEKIRFDLSNRPIISALEEINLRFIVSYFRNTFQGDIFSAGRKKDTNDYKKMYEEIKHFLSVIKTENGFYGKNSEITRYER